MGSLLSTRGKNPLTAVPPFLTRAMRGMARPLTISLAICALLATMQASAVDNRAVEHPGVVHKDDNCSSCHVSKTSGKSVHSAMALSCTICHLAETQGDMTTLTLSMPKTKICSACHQEGVLIRKCAPTAKQLCLDCHDAHSSNQRMLLLQPASGR